ncbi:cyclic diguanylate phosphodiesterase [Chitinibacter sp. ZOR0017]|uniref:EAL domain-containing protein n=1 Tax=Chitinibacter sp. ZOR0017 TaxID=1339254 RepID=UPI00064757EF|nr:cyclic diguanylate phosphodiesterase [Chitinibacter sp. ZOR0017]
MNLLLARFHLLLASLAGVLLAALILLLALAGVLQQEQQRLSLQQQSAGALLTTVASEVQRGFAFLGRQPLRDCQADSLSRLRSQLLNFRYLRSVGLLDEQRQLRCLTSHGELTPPMQLPPAQFIDAQGTQIWNDYPLPIRNGQVNSTLTARGTQLLLVDGHVSIETFQRAALDAVWISYADAPPHLIWARPTLAAHPQPPTNLRWRALSRPGSGWQIDWAQQRLVVGSNVPNTGLFVQNYRSLAELWRSNWALCALLATLAVLLGAISGRWVSRSLRRRGTLAYRLPQLLQPAHIHCMYQPIVELASGEIAGCEVLMRLKDGEHTIFPDQVIPLVQAQGLSWALDQAVSQRALAELATLLPAAPSRPFKVALNFFPEHIRHAQLSGLLDPWQHPRWQLNIEVTEYGVSEHLQAEVQQLRAAGYQISVDDFGTGYSNLGTIKYLAPDFLKIDRSFVADLEDDTLRASLIPQIVSIAEAVGAEIVAEGIETAQQAALLRAQGVRFGQGYWYSRPVPLAEFAQLLQQPPRPAPAVN